MSALNVREASRLKNCLIMSGQAPAAAKERKRKAVVQLRELAQEVGVEQNRRKTDLSRADFAAAHATVRAVCRTAEQQQRADALLATFSGEVESALPPVPAAAGQEAQPEPGAQPEPDAQAETKEFRFRSTSCLFTWNSKTFANWNLDVLWASLLTFLATLKFVGCWTATIERSLLSTLKGRIHLHVFVEFVSAVDWASLERMRFKGALPNASPTRARGDNMRVVKDQGHFYAWAWKEGTLKVGTSGAAIISQPKGFVNDFLQRLIFTCQNQAKSLGFETSGYEPWVDYAVKGCWIDELWTQHKLSHETYLHYAAQVRVGFVNRCKQVEAVQARERTAQQQKRRQEIAASLAPMQNAFRLDVLARLEPWWRQHNFHLSGAFS